MPSPASPTREAQPSLDVAVHFFEYHILDKTAQEHPIILLFVRVYMQRPCDGYGGKDTNPSLASINYIYRTCLSAHSTVGLMHCIMANARCSLNAYNASKQALRTTS